MVYKLARPHESFITWSAIVIVTIVRGTDSARDTLR